MDKQDYEYLKQAQLDPLKPQFGEDTMFSVARILISENVLSKPLDVLDFCERPDKWISDVKKLIKEYEENQ
jgi:hypothetical protein